MKRYLYAALAAALLTPGLWAVSARAQDEDAGPEMAEQHEGGQADHAKMAEHMKQRLGLSDDQAAKLKDAMKAHHDAMKPLWEQSKDAMKKLGEQLKAKAPDSDVQASLDALKAAHKAVAAEEERFHDSLSFLTATQRAKLMLGAMHMHREHMMHRHGPKGGDKDDDHEDDKGGGDKDGDQ